MDILTLTPVTSESAAKKELDHLKGNKVEHFKALIKTWREEAENSDIEDHAEIFNLCANDLEFYLQQNGIL